MCYLIESDLILANVLSKEDYENKGIEIPELKRYKNKIINAAESKGIDLYVDITSSSLLDSLSNYYEIFRMIGDRIYKINNIDLTYFNNQLPDEIVDLF